MHQYWPLYDVYCFFLQVKIWDDRKPIPLSILKPHDGQPVYSVAFLTAPEHPNHINLITAVCSLMYLVCVDVRLDLSSSSPCRTFLCLFSY
jgi:hypothetical protein